MSSDKSIKIKKTITSLLASTSILVGGIFSSPSDIPDNQYLDKIVPPAGIELVISDYIDDDSDDIVIPDEDKKYKNRFLSWYATRKLGTRLIISLIFIVAIMVLSSIVFFNLSSALPVIVRHILSFSLSVVIGLFSYLFLAKAISPDISIRKLLNWKNILAVSMISVALCCSIKFLLLYLPVHS